MTILYSYASKERLIMAADSAEVRDYSSGEREFTTCTSRLNILNPIDLVRLADLVLRFSIEITKEVSFPGWIYVINPRNDYKVIKRDSLSPLEDEEIRSVLSNLDLLGISSREIENTPSNLKSDSSAISLKFGSGDFWRE